MFSVDPICSEKDIQLLVHDFYAQVRKDALLGPIFNSHVQDWPRHLQHLCDFWSSILLHTGSFSGNPVMKHAQLPALTYAHFEHWLSLFEAATKRHQNVQMGQKAYMMAQRIAQSLWSAYPKTEASL